MLGGPCTGPRLSLTGLAFDSVAPDGVAFHDSPNLYEKLAGIWPARTIGGLYWPPVRSFFGFLEILSMSGSRSPQTCR